MLCIPRCPQSLPRINSRHRLTECIPRCAESLQSPMIVAYNDTQGKGDYMLIQTLERNRQQTIISSLILIMVGLLMLVIPEKYDSFFVEILGYSIIIFGGVMIWEFIAARKDLKAWILFMVVAVSARRRSAPSCRTECLSSQALSSCQGSPC